MGEKVTELEPFLWRRSKSLKTSHSHIIAIFTVLTEILMSTVWANFLGIDPIFFSCSIIDCFLRWYHALPLNPEFLVKNALGRGIYISPCAKYVGQEAMLNRVKCIIPLLIRIFAHVIIF